MNDARKKILVMLFGLAVVMAAIPARAADGSLFLFATEEAVKLRWNAPPDGAYEGFHVERRPAAGGEWKRLTGRPVTRMTDVGRIRDQLGPAAESFLTFFDPGLDTITRREFERVMSDPVARSMIQLFSVQHPGLARVLGERYDDTDLQAGREFVYRVVLVGPGGSESVWAEGAEPATHGEADQVPVPAGFTGEGADSTALFGWEHKPALSRSGVTIGYRIYRAQKPFGPFEPASYETIIPKQVDGSLPEHLYADQYLENGVTYWYFLTGVNLLGMESPATETIEVTPRDMEPPPPPEEFSARLIRGEHALLEWSGTMAEDLAGYAIYRGADSGGPFSRLAPEEEGTARRLTSYLDTTLVEGDIFWYYVTSVDTSGNESRPSDSIQVFRPDVTPPAAPEQVEAAAGEEGIRLSWRAGSEPDLAGYLVERTTGISGRGKEMEVSGPFYLQNTDPLAEPVFLDPVPAESQSRYAYQVVALDKAGNRSDPGGPVVARMPDRVPPTPPALYYAVQERNRVVLHWQASTEEDLAGYLIYRSAGGKDGFLRLTAEPLDPAAVQFEDRAAETGTLYSYRLTAVDEAGNESEPSDALQVEFLDLEAAPPEEVRAEVVAEGVRVSWRQAGGERLRLVAVSRRTGKDGEYEVVATLKPEALEFLDRRVAPGRTYHYRVENVDALGNRSEPAGPVMVEIGE